MQVEKPFLGEGCCFAACLTVKVLSLEITYSEQKTMQRVIAGFECRGST